MVIRAGGYVGINETDPARWLEISGLSTANAYAVRLTVVRNAADTWTGLEFWDDIAGGGVQAAGIIARRESSANAHGLVFSTNLTGVMTEQMVLTSAGRLGIGELSPDYKLDVNGTFGFTPGSSVTPEDNGDVVFEATDNTTFTIKLKGSDGTVRSGTVTLS